MEKDDDHEYKKPEQLQKAHDKINEIYDGNKNLKSNQLDLRDFTRTINKMYGRREDEHIQATIDHVFKMAQDRMESDHDKDVLVGLRQLVREIEEDLYTPNPYIKDAFFFPNQANIAKVANYIKKAKKTIELAIFSFTNDELANEIIAAHERGVKVRIITDDEAMKGKGADAQRCSDAGITVRTDNE